MKTQKVEVEIPIFDGYEFVEYGIVDKKHEKDFYSIYSPYLERLVCVKGSNSYFKQLHLIYKKKKPRRIIYEEVREDYLKQGDIYLDDSGCVNEWIYKDQSRDKHFILKKIRDDFEANND